MGISRMVRPLVTTTSKAAPPTLGPDGFLTVESLRRLVSQSGLLDRGGDVMKELLIFQTPRQRTWLLATENFVFVLLDDDGQDRKGTSYRRSSKRRRRSRSNSG